MSPVTSADLDNNVICGVICEATRQSARFAYSAGAMLADSSLPSGIISMTLPIPEPSSVINNLYQVADTRRRWQEQARSARADANAQLLAEARQLVDSMNRYANGYRKLCGLFQDFRVTWTPEQRQNAAKSFRAWVDPRNVSNQAAQHLSTLEEIRSDTAEVGAGGEESSDYLVVLDRIINNALFFFEWTIRPLLVAKESPVSRARFIDALADARTAEQVQVVTDWARDVMAHLNHSQSQLVSVNTDLGTLTKQLTALNQVNPPPAPKAPTKTWWNRRLTSPFKRLLHKSSDSS